MIAPSVAPADSRTIPPEAELVVDYWRQAGQEKWFKKDPAFDDDFRSRFLPAHMAAAQRHLDDWLEHAESALALLILLDQFPRNAFRGTAHMYATDPLARVFAQHIVGKGLDKQLPESLRVFCYLPFTHSENLADQQLAVQLNQTLGQPWLHHAEEHLEVIARFGRFPHRNGQLGRETTPAEQAFLDAGGFAG